jgi:predicted MFS family arabinose efflux permease
LDFVILMPLGAPLMRLFQITPVEFGVLVSAYTAAASVSGFLVALLIDRFARKTAILGLFGVFAAATLLCAIANDYHSLLIARAVAGGTGGVLQALIFAVIGETIPEERRGRATGVILSAFSLSSVFGVPVGLFLANRFDWQAPFYVLTGVCVVGWFFAQVVLPRMDGHLALQKKTGVIQSLGRFVEVFSHPQHRWAMALNITLVFGMFTFIPYLNPHLVQNVKLGEENLSLLYLCGGIFTIMGARLTGKLSDRYGKLEVFQVAAVIALLPILVISHLGPAPLPLVLTASTFFMVMMNARFVPATSMITSAARPESRGAFLSANASLQHLAMSAASLIGGWVVSVGLEPGTIQMTRVGYIALAFGVLSIPFARNLRRQMGAALGGANQDASSSV